MPLLLIHEEALRVAEYDDVSPRRLNPRYGCAALRGVAASVGAR